MGVGTHRMWLPDPSSGPTAARIPKQPWTLNLSHCSLFLSSPPDVNSWCNPRNNMEKFLACYFWQLLPPRKEGNYTVGYSGKLACRPQTRFPARRALMINPGHAEHLVWLQSAFGRASTVLDKLPTRLEGAIYLLSLFNE